MRRFLIVPVLAALCVTACVIVTDDTSDDDGAGADETGAEIQCADPGTNSIVAEDGSCFCEATHVWCDASNPNDFTCCVAACADPGTNSEFLQNGMCECLEGFVWCSDDPDDFTCCAV